MSEQPEKHGGPAACPKTFCSVLPCALICATIVFIVWHVVSPRPEPTRRLWVPVVVDTNGNQMILEETRQLEFWTPSIKTQEYLQNDAPHESECVGLPPYGGVGAGPDGLQARLVVDDERHDELFGDESGAYLSKILEGSPGGVDRGD